jgi:hypothetical protein
MLAVLAAVVALAVFLVRRTSWDLVEPVPLSRRRRLGEIVRASGRVYRRRAGTFSAVGAIAIPVAVLALVVGSVVRRLPFIGDLVVVTDSEGTGGRILLSSMLAGVFSVFAFVLVSAAVAWLVGGPQGADAGIAEAAGVVGARGRALASSFVPAAIVIVALGLTVIGLPIAVWLFVRWHFIAQVTMLEGREGRATLRRSADLVRGRWWHTALVVLIIGAVIGGIGLVVGLVLLIAFTGLPLWALSAVVAVCEVLAMPYGALVMTFLYGDAAAEAAGVTDDEAAAEPVLV